jgi:hypothetical protein
MYFVSLDLADSALAQCVAYDIDDWFRDNRHMTVIRAARTVNRLRVKLAASEREFNAVYDPVTLPADTRRNCDVIKALEA